MDALAPIFRLSPALVRVPLAHRRVSRTAAFCLALALAQVAGCSGVPVPTASPIPEPPDRPTAISPWGPLAVASREGGLQALATGTLEIGDSCVTLRLRDAVWLLVWPSERTWWVPATQSIRFRNTDDSFAEVSAGQQVMVTGGGDPGGSIGWIAAPVGQCATHNRWWVVDVESA